MVPSGSLHSRGKLTWLHEALMTGAMLPQARRKAWLMMRCEEPGASIPVESLWSDWPAFAVAVAAGSESVSALAHGFIARWDSPRHAREILLALREWLPFRPGARATDADIVEEALRELR